MQPSTLCIIAIIVFLLLLLVYFWLPVGGPSYGKRPDFYGAALSCSTTPYGDGTGMCIDHIKWLQNTQKQSCEAAVAQVGKERPVCRTSCDAASVCSKPTCSTTPYGDGDGMCIDHIKFLQNTQKQSCEAAVAQVGNERPACRTSCDAASICSKPTPLNPPGSACFRIVPLNFITNRNYFTPGSYGVRIGWLDSNQAPELAIDDKKVAWAKSGVIDPKKNSAPVNYSYLNVSLTVGPHKITVGSVNTYNVLIPTWGKDASGSSDLLFFGDININEDGVYGTTGAQRVMKAVVSRATDIPVAVFPGDIFYRDDWGGYVNMWTILNSTDNKKITEYLVVGVPGNHDYAINGSGVGSAIWVPIFFMSDGMIPFDQGLDSYQIGSKVPLLNTLQVFVIGSTCLILADNEYSDVDIANAVRTYDVNAKIKDLVDTVLISTHWNTGGMGAVSVTGQVVNTLAPLFPSLRVRGNTNHWHCNQVDGSNPNVMATGANGFHSDCGSAGRNNSCAAQGAGCCPTKYSKGQFLATGYNPGQVCDGLADVSAGVYKPDPTTTAANTKIAFDLNKLNGPEHYIPLTKYSSANQLIPTISPLTITDDYIIEGHPIIQAPVTHSSFLGFSDLLPLSEQSKLPDQYRSFYKIQEGYPHCDNLRASVLPSRAKPGQNCWTTPGNSPMRILETANMVIPDVL